MRHGTNIQQAFDKALFVRLLAGLCVWSGMCFHTASAESLPALSVNGRMTASDGSPLFGPIDIEINFYHQERGGSAVLPAPLLFQQVSLSNGLFQVSVSLDPEDVNAVLPAANSELWVSITDKTNAKQYPRQKYGIATSALKVPVDNQSMQFNARGELEVIQLSAEKLGSYPLDVGSVQSGQVLGFDGSKWVATTPVAGSSSGNITATAPLDYTNSVLSLPKATAGQVGYLDAADFQTFSGKEPAISTGTTAQYRRGDKQWSDFNTDARAAAVGDQIANGTADKAPSQNAMFDALVLKANSTAPSFTGPATVQVTGVPHVAAGNVNLITLIPATTATLNDDNTQPLLRFRDNDGGTPDYVSLRAPATLAANLTFTLPAADGTAGNALKTDGAGHLTWTSVSSAGAGAIADTEKAAASGIATLNASSLVVQDPANATATATASKIPIAGAGGKLDKAWLPAMVGDSGAGGAAGAAPAPASGDAAAGKFLKADATWIVPGNATVSAAGYMSATDKTNLNGLVSNSVMDADFGTNGLMRRTGAGAYDTVTDNTSNWNTAYTERRQWDGGSTNLVAATGRTSLGLGTAAVLDVGTGNNNIVQLDGSAKLPAVDGSLLTNLASQVNSTSVDAAGAVMNSDFSSNGIMSRTGAGTYAVVTNNSTNWNTAYGWGDHSAAGYLTSVPWATPGSIGSTTPAAGAFTTIAGTTITANTSLKLKENSGTHYVTLSAPSSMAANVAYIFPAAADNGKYLKTDASGNLSWDVPSGAGDMNKSTYDTNNNGIVDNVAALGGHADTYFTNADNFSDGIVNKPSSWNSAYSQRAQWDGGSTNLVAATGRTSLGLGTAAVLNVGTGNNNIVQLSSSAKLPAVDGSALTNLPAQVDSTSIDAAGAVMNTDFSSNGLMKRTGAGTYTVVTDSASDWDTAFGWGNHASAGYLTSVPWAAPGAIGGTTPAAGAFTTVAGTTITASTAVKFKENGGTHYVTLAAPAAMAADVAYIFPAAAQNGKYLTTDASGNLSWGTPAGAGDMAKATYDANTDGTVNNVAALNGHADTYFTNADNFNDGATNMPSRWNTAYSERLQWDGGSTNLVAATGRTSLGLGTAAVLNVGTGNNNIVQLDGTAKLPAVDGSALTNLPAQVNSTSVDAAGAVMNSDFGSNGIMSRTGAGTYAVVTNNSSNWDTAYGWGNHASAGYLTSIPWATPGAIGGTTPAAAAFTTIAGTTITASTSYKLKENGGSHYVTLTAPASMSADSSYVFPAAADSGKYLKTDASGNLSWGSPAGAGDMNKSTYDTNNDGVVDNTLALNSHADTYFTNADNFVDGIVNQPSSWNTAYSERAQWSGTSTNLVAATGRTSLGLGTAAVLNVGTGNNNIVQLDGTAKLPAVDGSALTNLPSQVTSGAVDSAGAVMNSDFSSNGIMSRTGAGTYAVVTDNSANWDTAYGWGNHASAGYLTSVPWASPSAIGGTTPAAATFTTLQANTSLKLRDGDTNIITIAAPSNLTADYSLTLPVDDGTSGQILQTDGTGVTSWSTPADVYPGLVQGRLTAATGNANPTTDITAAGTLYFTPFRGNRIVLRSGSSWVMRTFVETSLTLAVTSGKNYDVFAYDNSGTMALELSSAWTDDVTRANALTLLDGVYVKNADNTRLYLGTIRASATNQIEDSEAKRFIWNNYNRIGRRILKSDGTSHAYNNVVRQYAANAANKIEFVRGLDEDTLNAVFSVAVNATGPACAGAGVGLDNTTNMVAVVSQDEIEVNGVGSQSIAIVTTNPSLGYHALVMLESSCGPATVNWLSGTLVGYYPM